MTVCCHIKHAFYRSVRGSSFSLADLSYLSVLAVVQLYLVLLSVFTVGYARPCTVLIIGKLLWIADEILLYRLVMTLGQCQITDSILAGVTYPGKTLRSRVSKIAYIIGNEIDMYVH